MRFETGCPLEEILRIHHQIFTAPFPLEQYRKKLASGQKMMSVGLYSGDEQDELAGYCVVIDHAQERRLHTWMGGVLPHFQARGIFSRFYDWLIQLGRDGGYRSITANTDNYKPQMIHLLVSKGFSITGTGKTNYGDGTKILFRYSLHDPIRLRLSVTNACNLNCFFCHGEGTDIPQTIRMPLPELERILVQAWKCGVEEITITGGEPAVYFDAVEYILKYCGYWKTCPKINIITNGLLWTQDRVKQLAQYRGPLSMHVSLPSADENRLKRVWGVSLEKHQELIGWLNQEQIDFRLNTVVLRGINSEPEDFRKMLRFACANGVKYLHFMELLLTKSQENLLPFYCSFQEINQNFLEAVLPEGTAALCRESEKKRMFSVNYCGQSLEVSLYRLSCRCGCGQCMQVNDFTIGADGKGYPCYLRPSVSCGDAVSSLLETVGSCREYVSRVPPDFAFDQLYWG